MKLYFAIAAALLSVPQAIGTFPRSEYDIAAAANASILNRRASAEAPSGYAPASVTCPYTRPSIRCADKLSPEESSWLKMRKNNTVQPMKDFLARLNIDGFDTTAYIDRFYKADELCALPNIAISFSGGGWRALLNGAGAMAAFDSRTDGATNPGNIGGLLQSSTYLVGVSGGNWLVGSLATNNFIAVQDIMKANSPSLWDFSNPIWEGPKLDRFQFISTIRYYVNLFRDVHSKESAGFNPTMTDYWGRLLSYYLVDAGDGGPGYTWSSIADDDGFKYGNTPMPISVADARDLGQSIPVATNFELNPFEMGSWDPTIGGFAPMRYVGSSFSEGQLPLNESCISGFDNVGFVMATSSSIFNAIILQFSSYVHVPSLIKDAIRAVLTDIDNDHWDISKWVNPFYLWKPEKNPFAYVRHLPLVDGGEDLQNIGFDPVVQPHRHVDVIFAVDSSGDTLLDSVAPNWPTGATLVATYQHYAQGHSSIAHGVKFPVIPDTNTMVNLGLNSRPTFFGCNSSAAAMNASTPLVVYLPNAPYVYQSNVPTNRMTFSESERNAMITNGYNVATMGNGTLNVGGSSWATCVGCAVLWRSLARTKTQPPAVCYKCMQDYCWDGTYNTNTPAPYNPSLKLPNLAIST